MEHLGSAPFVEPGQVLLGEEEDQDRRSGQHEERQMCIRDRVGGWFCAPATVAGSATSMGERLSVTAIRRGAGSSRA